jgi:asparagine synthase (glutamine-hydrolysing)
MCGIFGAVFLRETDQVDTHAALGAMAYRGPDDRGVHEFDGGVLGHLRLSILDLSPAGHQPMLTEDGALAVVFNGEIYNHHEVRRELESRGATFRSRSDTEVILHGYRAWGDGIIERLDGMFAIGLFDARERRLILATDRAGKKPLFYAERGGAIWFASEAKALLAAGLEAEVDPQALAMMLTFGYTPAPGTMYRGVSKLAPASMLRATNGHPPRLTTYWRAPWTGAPRIKDPVDVATRTVRTLVEKAVERRLEADVPLGAFLSGGVDSTIIAGTMAKVMGRNVKTFSIGFTGDDRYDETHYARIAARAFGTEHTEYKLEPSSFDLVEKLVEMHDGPFGDSSAIPTSVVSMLTRRHVTVALTGDGGDELFCGYPRFLWAENAERVPAPLRSMAARVARAIPARSDARSIVARGKRFAERASQPLADRLFAWTTYFDLRSVLRADVQRAIDLEAPRAWNRARLARYDGGTTLSRILGHNFDTYLPYDLLIKADRSSMLHSLELRSPFLDTALIEYVARLPDAMKRRGTTTKWILRRAFDDLIPQEIQTRAKMGFGVPLGAWFRGDLKAYLGDHFGPKAEIYDYLDRGFVEQFLASHWAGHDDNGHRIWLLLTLQVWLRSLSSRKRRRDRAPSDVARAAHIAGG